MGKYIAIISLLAAVALPVSGVLIYLTVRVIKRQIKLHYSITLVELRAPKIQYYICAALTAAVAFYCIVQMCDPGALILKTFKETLGASRLQTNLALGCALVLSCSFLAFVGVLSFSKNAVVDKGVFTNFDRVDWYNVCDYIIDEERCLLILSSSRGAFSTLRGTTPPFKVAKNDIPKLMFILNKNKNKFSGFYN